VAHISIVVSNGVLQAPVRRGVQSEVAYGKNSASLIFPIREYIKGSTARWGSSGSGESDCIFSSGKQEFSYSLGTLKRVENHGDSSIAGGVMDVNGELSIVRLLESSSSSAGKRNDDSLELASL
jgi:hypothetical protein